MRRDLELMPNKQFRKIIIKQMKFTYCYISVIAELYPLKGTIDCYELGTLEKELYELFHSEDFEKKMPHVKLYFENKIHFNKAIKDLELEVDLFKKIKELCFQISDTHETKLRNTKIGFASQSRMRYYEILQQTPTLKMISEFQNLLSEEKIHVFFVILCSKYKFKHIDIMFNQTDDELLKSYVSTTANLSSLRGEMLQVLKILLIYD